MEPEPSLRAVHHGRFEILRPLGEGGMGAVFVAYDRERGHKVALKTLRAYSAAAILMFKNEFRLLQDLQHPNLVRFGEMFEENGEWFFTMELLAGTDLLSYVCPGKTGEDPANKPLTASTTDLSKRLTSATPSAWSAPEVEDPPTAGLDCADSEGSTAPAEAVDQALVEYPELATFDEDRLRTTFGQICAGLFALHKARRVHRDIKPSNIIVTPSGRAVILDFGIAISTDDNHRWGPENTIGTAAFMAPEQCQSGDITAAADWYSVGVMLFLALTGRLPFMGQVGEIIRRKQFEEAPLASAFAKSLPADLVSLCSELLRRSPTERPSDVEILRRLNVAHEAEETMGRQFPEHFAGRRSELSILEHAFQEVRSGRCVPVVVSGESGVGKSYLVRHTIELLSRDVRELTVLRGRCYEREAVPYKAVDSIIDELSRCLSHLPADVAASLIPENCRLITKLFPVLDAVLSPYITGQDHEPLDAVEFRLRAFDALRALFERLARIRPTIVTIDDLQWADSDSYALLSAILSHSSPPPLLLIATVRDSGEQKLQLDLEKNLSRLGSGLRRLPIGRFGNDEAHQLARTLLSDGTHEGAEIAEAIVREAQGHPLFIDELVRQRRLLGAQAASLKLDAALWLRVSRLDPAARQLLEVVALACKPLSQGLLARAVGAGPDEFDTCATKLRIAHLIRSSGPAAADTMEPYHDRIRESTVHHIAPEARKLVHQRLATALESVEPPDAESLLVHWEEAGERQKASRYALVAAEQARAALAFERAASLYEKTLALADWEPERRQEIYIKLAEALANANRAAGSANAYLSAAEGANFYQNCRLRMQAVYQFLRCGYATEARRIMREVLTSLNISYPTSGRHALLLLLWRKIRLMFRGMKFVLRDKSCIPMERQLRLDAYRSASALSSIDLIQGYEFGYRHLIEALEAGDAGQIAFGLPVEIAGLSTNGPANSKKVEKLISIARELAEREADPYLLSRVEFAESVVYNLRGRFRLSNQKLEICDQLLRDKCTGVATEKATNRQMMAGNLLFLGELRKISAQMVHLEDAVERGDLYEETNIRTLYAPFHYLSHDKPDLARREIDIAFERWPTEQFDIQHWQGVYARAFIDLYEQKGGSGYAYFLSVEPKIRASFVLMAVQMIRVMAFDIKGRLALAAVRDSKQDKGALLKVATKAARQVEREDFPCGAVLAAALRAGIAAVQGLFSDAVRHLEFGIQAAETHDLGLHGAAMRRRLGEHRGSDEGRALIEAADAQIQKSGISNPARWAAMVVPGFPQPSGK